MKITTKVAFDIIIYPTLLCAIIYGAYWCTKTVSYQFFYEEMVQQVVQEMVKAECLNGTHNH